jgi:hypothetical protein
MDLDAYRLRAEGFVAELGREYYRHYAGLKERFEIEPVYERHADLFERGAIEQLRQRGPRALLDFAVEGHLGQATKAAEAELARREASLELDPVGGPRLGYRESAAAQANEPDRGRREATEAARLEATERHLNPLRGEVLERWHALARDLGWPSYRAMCEEVKGIDLGALHDQTAAFAAASEDAYAAVVEPELRRTVGVGLAELRRSDLPRLYRDRSADDHFPAGRLVASFEATLAGLGVDLRAQDNMHLDVERRPRKSPRAFCAPVRVPAEIYLVVAPIGGRDDFAALLHEGGHAQHFAHVDSGLAFESRHLGDNAITEAFAFLFERLVQEPEWLRRRLGVEGADELAAPGRARSLVLMRRYAAKLAYELELHEGGRPPAQLAGSYARRLSQAVRVDWPAAMSLVDVDPGFYCAAYLRAWALETHLRALLHERHGPAWFEDPAAGDTLRSLWRRGQSEPAEALLARATGAELDFSAMLVDLGLAQPAVRP